MVYLPSKPSTQNALLTFRTDVDDEVRDRAALALRICDESEDRDFGKRFLRNDSMFSLPVLE